MSFLLTKGTCFILLLLFKDFFMFPIYLSVIYWWTVWSMDMPFSTFFTCFSAFYASVSLLFTSCAFKEYAVSFGMTNEFAVSANMLRAIPKPVVSFTYCANCF